MALIYFLTLILAASLCGISEAQVLARRPLTSSCSFDELNVLLTLARAIDENECSRSSCKNNIDVEEIIMKLINALVYTTITNSKNNGGSGGSRSTDEALIDLGLLNPNDHDNILKLDLAKQKLLGIGLGNTD